MINSSAKFTVDAASLALAVFVVVALGVSFPAHAEGGAPTDPLLQPLAQADHPLKDAKDKPRDYHRKRAPLSESQIDEALELLDTLHPDLAAKLREHRSEQANLSDEQRRKVGAIIQHRFPRLRYLLYLKKTDPEMYELRVEDVRLTLESRRVAERYTTARREDDRQRMRDLEDGLEGLLEEHFEVRQQLHELELQRLEQRIETLRDQIEAREDDRDDVIEQRLGELIGTDDGARW